MTADLDTLLTALYVLIDDHMVASGLGVRHRSRTPKGQITYRNRTV